MYKNMSAKYDQENKERLQKKVVKDIKIFLNYGLKHYGCERYKNLSEDEKQRPVEYRKKYYRMIKNVIL